MIGNKALEFLLSLAFQPYKRAAGLGCPFVWLDIASNPIAGSSGIAGRGVECLKYKV